MRGCEGSEAMRIGSYGVVSGRWSNLKPSPSGEGSETYELVR